MALKQIVTCDVDGCEMSFQEMKEMMTVNVVYNNVKEVPVNNDGVTETKRVVLNQERYEFHIGEDHSEEFLKYIQDFFKGEKHETRKKKKRKKR